MLDLHTISTSGATAYAVIKTVQSNTETGVAELLIYDTITQNFVSTGFTGDAGASGFDAANCALYFTEVAGASGNFVLSANPNINGTYDATAYRMVGAAPNISNDFYIGTAEIYYTYSDDTAGGANRRPVESTLSTGETIIERINSGVLTEFESRQLKTIYSRVLRDNTSSGL